MLAIGVSPAGLMTVTDPTRRIPSLAGDDGPVLTEANADDVADIAALAALRREAYEVAQPQFWAAGC